MRWPGTRESRFWAKVDRSGDCWLWTGHRNEQGYGKCYLFGRLGRFAHRVAWEYERGPISPGICVLHRCDNPSCVRIDHLFLGTRDDNNKDRALKGRSFHASGSLHSQAKLTEARVLDMRARYGWVRLGQGRRPKGQPSNVEIAKEFGVSHYQVSLILRRKEWTHI